jgi:hypothetical protein
MTVERRGLSLGSLGLILSNILVRILSLTNVGFEVPNLGQNINFPVLATYRLEYTCSFGDYICSFRVVSHPTRGLLF